MSLTDLFGITKRVGEWLIPKMTSPRDSFWGGAKDLILNQDVEIARVNVDLPSLFTTEIAYAQSSSVNAFNVTMRITVGVGRSVFVREFLLSELDPVTGITFTDPIFQLSFDRIGGPPSPIRLRFVVWGTMIRIEARANHADAVRKFETSVTPGSGTVVQAAIVGVSPLTSFQQNALSATRSDVAQNAASVVIISGASAILGSHGVTIYNDSGSDLYLRDGSGAASLTNFSRRVPPQQFWEMPFPFYTNEIRGIWSAAGGGAARITQWTRP